MKKCNLALLAMCALVASLPTFAQAEALSIDAVGTVIWTNYKYNDHFEFQDRFDRMCKAELALTISEADVKMRYSICEDSAEEVFIRRGNALFLGEKNVGALRYTPDGQHLVEIALSLPVSDGGDYWTINYRNVSLDLSRRSSVDDWHVFTAGRLFDKDSIK